jgi:hypothetical protein
VVPEPFVRLDVADLTKGAPTGDGVFASMADLNNRGDMVGFGNVSDFLLVRVGGGP